MQKISSLLDAAAVEKCSVQTVEEQSAWEGGP